jgi:hypothetical protein
MLANSLGHYNNLRLISQITWKIYWIIKGRNGHFGDLRVEFLNNWFRWFFEINAQFEIFAQPTPITPRKQPLEFWCQRSLIGTLQTSRWLR